MSECRACGGDGVIWDDDGMFDCPCRAHPTGEREATVAWLRKAAKTSGRDHGVSGTAISFAADLIERGEHLSTRQGDGQ